MVDLAAVGGTVIGDRHFLVLGAGLADPASQLVPIGWTLAQDTDIILGF